MVPEFFLPNVFFRTTFPKVEFLQAFLNYILKKLLVFHFLKASSLDFFFFPTLVFACFAILKCVHRINSSSQLFIGGSYGMTQNDDL